MNNAVSLIPLRVMLSIKEPLLKATFMLSQMKPCYFGGEQRMNTTSEITYSPVLLLWLLLRRRAVVALYET